MDAPWRREPGMRHILLVFVSFILLAAQGCADKKDDYVDLGHQICESLDDLFVSKKEADYWVTKQGSDENDGRTHETAFATVQRGIDALSPGETLVIGPGEYLESVQRDGLGGPDAFTTIRAEIPGTVILRGDIKAPVFERLDGYRFIWVADLDTDYEISAVNELDTLRVIRKRPGHEILDFEPGMFYFDRDAGRLYLSTSDRKPAAEHLYTLSVFSSHGLRLDNPEQVIIEGLSVTGFNGAEAFGWEEFSEYAIWGILLVRSRNSLIRDCRAWLNGRGIGITCAPWEADESLGGNVIAYSEAFANSSLFGSDQSGGITLIGPKRDVICRSTSYMNGGVGINIGGGTAETSSDPSFESAMSENLSWGNELGDYKIKTGYDHIHHTDHSVGLGVFSHSTHPRYCLAGSSQEDAGSDTILLDQEIDLDSNAEFADPDHYDFRLQSTSRFRGSAAGGGDRGPFPYTADVFFVDPSGSDGNDGLSVSNAWQSLDRATRDLRPGDTLYLSPGRYTGDLTIQLSGEAGNPISILGRGVLPVVLEGAVQIRQSSHVELRRLSFARDVEIADCAGVSFFNSLFMGSGRALRAAGAADLEVVQCTFTGFMEAALDLSASSGAFLAGNLYDNRSGVAVMVDDLASLLYSDRNSYADDSSAWSVGGVTQTLQAMHLTNDSYSRAHVPVFVDSEGVPSLSNGVEIAGGGTRGRRNGVYDETIPKNTMRLVVEPYVYSVSASSANMEWITSLPATAEISWGETPDMENTESYSARSFATYSLNGLSPNTTYYFSIRSLAVPDTLDIVAEPITVSSTVLSFTTAAEDPEPQTYYVSNDGDNVGSGLDPGSPWRTIQHAANRVRPGDRVIIAGGTYNENIYIRSTGTPGRPITFQNQPGERVQISGAMGLLSNGFVVAKKSFLRFDGLYFKEYAGQWGGPGNWFKALWAGDFNLYLARDIEISRILSDGRAMQSYTVVARDVEDLTMSNIVIANKFTCLELHFCPNLRIEHSVVIEPWIWGFILYRNDPGRAVMDSNIFTDSFDIKASANVPLFYSSAEDFVQTNSVYLLRYPADWRFLVDALTAYDAPDTFVEPLFVDPEFLGAMRLIEAGETIDFAPDRLVGEDVKLDFDTFFATSSEVTERGIGLQPELFNEDGVPN